MKYTHSKHKCCQYKFKWKSYIFTFVLLSFLLTCYGCKNADVMDEPTSDIISESKAKETEHSSTAIATEDTEMQASTDSLAAAAAIAAYETAVMQMNAGDIVDMNMIETSAAGNLFYANDIDEALKERIMGISYTENHDISLTQLRYLRMLYYGFDGKTHVGEMIVNEKIAADVLSIFQALYQQNYPIEQMVLVDDYQGQDEASMESNNTTAFNYRLISGSSKLSNHSFGMAIDLNPKYNPYVRTKADGTTIFQPENGSSYADREAVFDHKVTKEDPAYQLFTEAGFSWGGDWNSVKDYQHFEKADN